MSSSIEDVRQTIQKKLIAPMASPIPSGPEGEFFNADQWRTLLSIMDAIIPKVVRESVSGNLTNEDTVPDSDYNAAILHLKENVVNAPDGKSLEAYLEERPSDMPDFEDILLRTLVQYSREDARKGLAGLCGALKYALSKHLMSLC